MRMPQDTAANADLLHELASTGDYENSTSKPNNNNNNNILFGKYELGRLLGHGAFAKVYHARHTTTGESVAIKAVSKRRVIKSGHVEHIKREIAIMRRVRHPNVIRLHEVLATKTKIFFVMDFAKGGELFSRVARGGRFGESLCRRYFRQLISAVGHCHKLGVFHRDIKPENLLLDADWNLKVSDFGLSAVVLGGGASAQEKVLHTLCGTPAYVSPEMLARKGYGGAAADIWSCGVVLFVLAAGYLPFNDCNLMNMYRKIYRGEYRCPRWFSPGLKRLMSRLLDTNPETRITIDEIYEEAWFRESDDGGSSSSSDQDEIQSSCSDDQYYYRSSGEWEDLVAGLKPDGGRCVNAFDIISTSSGFDLSGLFTNSCAGDVAPPEALEVEEMFVSGESVERIIDRIEKVGMEAVEDVAEVEAKRKEWWVRMEGAEGSFVINVGVHRLTEELVAIEVRRREKAGCLIGPDFWKCKLRPQICGLSLSGSE